MSRHCRVRRRWLRGWRKQPTRGLFHVDEHARFLVGIERIRASAAIFHHASFFLARPQFRSVPTGAVLAESCSSLTPRMSNLDDVVKHCGASRHRSSSPVRLLAGLAAVIACSCTPVTQFTATDTTATLRYVVTPGPIDTVLWYVDRAACPETTHLTPLATTGNSDPSRLAKASSPEGSGLGGASTRLEFPIPTAGPFMFYLSAQRGIAYSCENAGVFTPRPGGEYELHYLIDPQTFVCVVQVRDLVSEAGSKVRGERDPTTHFFYPPDFNAGFCKISIPGEH